MTSPVAMHVISRQNLSPRPELRSYIKAHSYGTVSDRPFKFSGFILEVLSILTETRFQELYIGDPCPLTYRGSLICDKNHRHAMYQMTMTMYSFYHTLKHGFVAISYDI